MRGAVLLVFLLLTGFLAGCSDAVGIGLGRSVDGAWAATVDYEDIFVTLTEDRGEIWGSGSWGFDAVRVRGNRAGADVSLVFEFSAYNPINFQGTLRGDRLEGWLTGSGFRGDPATFWRD